MSKAWINSYSGNKVYTLSPTTDSISIIDIAHALSNICRFTGHSKFYSVAQHSVLVSYACDPADALWALLHDASEAIISDLNSPTKHSPELAGYRDIEERIMNVICEKFGLQMNMPDSVKKADEILLATEVRDLLYNRHPDWVTTAQPLTQKIYPVYPESAKEMFLDRFRTLTTERI